jgi:hypothetical protein
MPSSNSRLSTEERRALEVLAKSADGCTTSIMLAHGFASSVLAQLITTGLATAKSEHIRAGQRAIDVTRVRITYAGRVGLARRPRAE